MQGKRLNRLNKELANIKTFPEFSTIVDENNPRKWYISFKGVENTLYAGQNFTLQFTFSVEYVKHIFYNLNIQPIESPEVIFIGNIPVHECVYSNGFICLNILYNGWSPAWRVHYICSSILSMLSSAKVKKKPIGDRIFSARKYTGPKQIKWFFDYINIQYDEKDELKNEINDLKNEINDLKNKLNKIEKQYKIKK